MAIQWGPIGDVGVFINEVGDNDTVMGFTEPQRLRSCFQSLDMLMSQSEPIVTSYVPADKDDDRHQSSANIVEAMCGILGMVCRFSSIIGLFTLGELHYSLEIIQFFRHKALILGHDIYIILNALYKAKGGVSKVMHFCRQRRYWGALIAYNYWIVCNVNVGEQLCNGYMLRLILL